MVELWRVDPADGVAYEWFSYLEYYEWKHKKSAIESYWYQKCKPIFGDIAQEKRIDPADGCGYTFEEMSRYYKRTWKGNSVEAYWNKCKKVPSDSVVQKRIDPVDMEAYTFEEIAAHYRKEGFSEEKIQTYWEKECAFVTISPLLLPASAQTVVPPLSNIFPASPSEQAKSRRTKASVPDVQQGPSPLVISLLSSRTSSTDTTPVNSNDTKEA
jgi:hypothetical protein